MSGFPNYSENMNLARTFSLKEKARLEFRAEAFNTFNRVIFGAGGTTLGSATFGKVTSAGAGRRLQLVAKISW
jgi:hypothetical protein